jgi:hypothetical protein
MVDTDKRMASLIAALDGEGVGVTDCVTVHDTD